MAHNAWITSHWARKPKDDADSKAMKEEAFKRDKAFGE